MSGFGPSGGSLVMIKIVSYELPESIFWLQLTNTNKVTTTNKVIEIYTGYSSTFLELEYLRVWNTEPNRVQYIHQKSWLRHFVNEQSNRYKKWR